MKNKIPPTIIKCFNELMKNSSGTDLLFFKTSKEKNGFILGTHFSVGLSMRNNWHLWGKNKLTKFFNQLGVYHADDISTIIITSFHRYLNNKDIELKKQAKFFIDFWKKEGFKNGNPLIEKCKHDYRSDGRTYCYCIKCGKDKYEK